MLTQYPKRLAVNCSQRNPVRISQSFGSHYRKQLLCPAASESRPQRLVRPMFLLNRPQAMGMDVVRVQALDHVTERPGGRDAWKPSWGFGG
jgi:hypothetical protein